MRYICKLQLTSRHLQFCKHVSGNVLTLLTILKSRVHDRKEWRLASLIYKTNRSDQSEFDEFKTGLSGFDFK